jgi:hypothetical protein
LLSIQDAFHLPRAFLRIWRTSSVRSRTAVLVLLHGDAEEEVASLLVRKKGLYFLPIVKERTFERILAASPPVA